MRTSPEHRRSRPSSNPAKSGLTWYMRRKLAVTAVVILLALFALVYRIWSIQKNNSEAYNQKVLSQQRYDSLEIPYRRGDIVDRNGTYLATTNKVYNLILDPSQINAEQEDYLEPTVSLLTEVFGYDADDLRKVIADRSTSHYVRYAKQLTHDQKEQFENRKKEVNNGYKAENDPHRVYGVWFEDSYLREYPYGAMACSVLGFSMSDGAEGSGGIEQYYNSDLIGTSGREYGYLNDESNLQRVIKPAVDGNTIVSTIDMKVQSTIEKYIDQFDAEMGGDTVACIVMQPQTGEILGMATNHRFDLNNPRDLTTYYTQEQIDAMDEQERTDACFQLWRNFCVSDTYEPGSVSKIFTVAAGLENGAISGNETYDCQGYLEVGGWQIHCAKRTGHGVLNVTQGIMQSCNVVMMRIAQAVGAENFCKTQRLFGFGSRTGIDLPGEADTATLIHSPNDMSSSDLATNSFGQNYNCTMVQTAAAFCSAINGGSYYQPHVVKRIMNAQGAVIRDIQPQLVRETCSAETSAFLRNALHLTVTEGTGKAAGVEGYDIGGKTGTAEKYPRKNGNYLVSFCGFAPTDDPQVLCYVIVDTPHTADQPHSTYASGIFHNIMAEILPYLNVYPSTPENEDGSAAEGLPESEGITDNTVTEAAEAPAEPETPSIEYDTEESLAPGAGEDLPGQPAGINENGETISVPETDSGGESSETSTRETGAQETSAGEPAAQGSAAQETGAQKSAAEEPASEKAAHAAAESGTGPAAAGTESSQAASSGEITAAGF